MGAKRGRMIYVPPVIVDEVKSIQSEDNIVSRPEAFRSLAKYARVGRETKRLMRLDFKKTIPQKQINSYKDELKPMLFDNIRSKKRKKDKWTDEFLNGGAL
jgi:hypothetical protein